MHKNNLQKSLKRKLYVEKMDQGKISIDVNKISQKKIDFLIKQNIPNFTKKNYKNIKLETIKMCDNSETKKVKLREPQKLLKNQNRLNKNQQTIFANQTSENQTKEKSKNKNNKVFELNSRFTKILN